MQSYSSILGILNRVLCESGSPRAGDIVLEVSRRIARADDVERRAVERSLYEMQWHPLDACEIEKRMMSMYSGFKKEVNMPNEEPKNEKPANPAIAMLQKRVDTLEATLASEHDTMSKYEHSVALVKKRIVEAETELGIFKKALKKIS